MASNRPGEMQQVEFYGRILHVRFQWPQIGRVRCNGMAGRIRIWFTVSMASNRPGEMQRALAQKGQLEIDGFNGLKSAG